MYSTQMIGGLSSKECQKQDSQGQKNIVKILTGTRSVLDTQKFQGRLGSRVAWSGTREDFRVKKMVALIEVFLPHLIDGAH